MVMALMAFVASDLRDSEIWEVLVPQLSRKSMLPLAYPTIHCCLSFVVRECRGIDLGQPGALWCIERLQMWRVHGEQCEIGACHDAISCEHDLFHLLVRDVAGPFTHRVLRMQCGA